MNYYPNINGENMDTVSDVWFLPSENTWKDATIMAYRDKGIVKFTPDGLTFTGNTYNIFITNIQSVCYGKQGRDFINNWVRVEYRSDEHGDIQQAFFADGGLLGWSGIFGGTKKLFKKIKTTYL